MSSKRNLLGYYGNNEIERKKEKKKKKQGNGLENGWEEEGKK